MDETPESRKRGRPAAPPGSSLGSYLRELRLARGWTIRDLARAVGLPASSAGYLSQMEAGIKVPHHSLAMRLARELGDPKGVFVLWAEISARNVTRHAAIARRELARILEDPSLAFDPRFLPPGTSRYERQRELLRIEEGMGKEQEEGETPRWLPNVESIPHLAYGASPPTFARAQNRVEGGYRVPILPEGIGPDTARELYLMSPTRPDVEFVRISGDALGSKKMHQPFAYRMTETSVQRVATVLRPGDVVVISQEQVPIVEHEIYAIRHEGRVVLAHAIWNERQLLLLPDTGKSDFVTLPARDDAELAQLVVGHMVTVLRAPA